MEGTELLLDRLIRNEVEFVVVGGVAAVLHGASISTMDIDICCRFSAENLMRLQEALADLHPYHRMTPSRAPLELTPEVCSTLKNLYLATDHGQLDCLCEIAGVGNYERSYQESIAMDLGYGVCRILCLSALIRAKEAMGQPKDLQAAVQLRAIQERAGDGPSPQ